MERNFILDLIFTSEIIFKYKLCIINQDTPVKLEQSELSQKGEFDHTCSGRIDMSYPSNGNHSDVLHIKSSYENED